MNENNTAKASTFDSAWNRVATLTRGTKSRVVHFKFDVIDTSTHYVAHGDINAVISPAEYSELS
jgi:hypothetical protein